MRVLVSGLGLGAILPLLVGCGSSREQFPSLQSSVSDIGWVAISGDTYGPGATVAEVNAFATDPHDVRLDVSASSDVATTTSYEVECDRARFSGPSERGTTPLTRSIRIPRGPLAGPPGAVQCFIRARATKPTSVTMTVRLLRRISG